MLENLLQKGRERLKYANTCGKLMVMIGILLLVPTAVIFFYSAEAEYAPCFLIPAGFSVLLGGAVCALCGGKEGWGGRLRNMRRACLTVLFAWCFAILAGAVPFILGGRLTVPQALFEAVSGWTTTGLSVLDLSNVPRIFLFHRSFMQFCGGLGFVTMMLLFVQDRESMNLFSAEGHPDKLMPNLRKTARIIFCMYMTFLVAGTLLYRLFGMSFFDGINHAMCALSTGGFSTMSDSIGAYNSVGAEAVTIVLMLVGTTNFAVLLLIVRRRFQQAARVSEVRFMAAVLLVSVPLIFFFLRSAGTMQTWQTLRAAFFNVVSAVSTSGFSTMSYQDWPPAAIGLLIILMLIGGGIGSTAGGIKLMRVYLMIRICADNLRKRVLSGRSIRPLYYNRAQGRTELGGKQAADTSGFIFTYLSLFIVGSLALSAVSGRNMTDSMFEFASSLGTVGLSIGITSPDAGAAVLLIEMLGMLLGRLEIFLVFVGMAAGCGQIRDTFRKIVRSRQRSAPNRRTC